MSGLDDLFGPPSSDLDDPFADIGRSPATEVSQEANIDQVLAGHDTSTVYNSTEHTVNDEPFSQESSDGASYDERGQWHDSHQPAVPTDHANQSYTYQTTYNNNSYAPAAGIQTAVQGQYAPQHTVTQSLYAPPQNQYTPASSTQSPYVPKDAQSTQSPYAPQSSGQSPYVPQSSQATSMYSPYAPQNNQVTSTYTPYVPQNTQATSTYSPYVPQSTQAASTQTPYAPPPQPQHKPPTSVPPSSTVVPRVPLNRPVISNAYDPPFPTTIPTSRRRPPSNTYNATAGLPLPPSRPLQHNQQSPTEPPLHRNTAPSGLNQPFSYKRSSVDGLPHPSAPPSNLFATQVPNTTAAFSSVASSISPPSTAAHQVSDLDHYNDSRNNGLGNGYHSPPVGTIERTSSPASVYSLNGGEAETPLTAPTYGRTSDLGSPSSSDPYAPAKSRVNGFTQDPPPSRVLTHHATPSMRYVPQTDVSRNRSMSNGSTYSTGSTGDHYASGQHHHQGLGHGDYAPRHDNPPTDFNGLGNSTLAPPQEITIKASTLPPYAPSPSLIGTNDPLGRTSARAPVLSFGFGGKLVTCFHGVSTMSTGFDVALSSRNSTGVQIRVLNKLIPQSALETTTAVFPGPLFQDPGSPTGLVRPSASTQAKAKKEKLLKYLTEREQEITLGVGYLHTGSPEWKSADGKLVLVKLLKVLVENDGRITGSPQTDSAVRKVLVPHLETTVSGDSDAPQLGFPAFGDVHANEDPISVSTLRPSSLDKIQDFLLKGQRRQAYHYALDEKLWAHAMVIASGIDKEAWKEVVNEFLKTELGGSSEPSSSHLRPSPASVPAAVNGREGLRVAYSLFSGQGAAAVQELVPQKSLSSIAIMGTTPVTPNFAQSGVSSPIPLETLSKWTEAVAMILSGNTSTEVSAALTALGDQLNAHQWIEAAHACYLLSPQTSPIGGLGHSSARITLLGSLSPQIRPNFFKDPDPIIFSEILEFALCSTPAAKGQEPFGGLPHLQAYRFIRAVSLAEIGDVQSANRYCDAITASLSRASPYFTPVLLDQLKGLVDRIQGVAHVDKSGSWIGGKLSKPSLDSIGGWLEGRFTKLVTGDSESITSPEEEAAKASQRGFVGPFSHYSTISSTSSSTSPSPQPTLINNNTLPIPRAGSAMSNRSVPNNYAPIDRASSAIDYTRRRNSPAPRFPSAASANATTTTFSQSPSFVQPSGNNQAQGSTSTMTPKPSDEPDDGQEASWWGAYASNNQTPVAATFMQVADSELPSGDGFISLMASTPVPTAPVSTKPAPHPKHEDEDEGEDLGFGNSKPREKKASEGNPQAEKAQKPTPEQPAAPEQANSGGWLSRWWKGSGPVKANLGEQTSFYYDKDLKRWVNKGAESSEAAKPATPPPPPSRAQTASPGMTGHNRPPLAGSTPPPARAASAIDLSNSPPPTKSVMRIRSNLVPTPEAESAPSTPTGSREGSVGPPSGRPRSQASKRNVRSRYVDVFQEGAA